MKEMSFATEGLIRPPGKVQLEGSKFLFEIAAINFGEAITFKSFR